MLSVCLGKLELLKRVIQNTPREIKTLLLSIPTTIGQRNHEEQKKVRSHLFKINEVASQLFIKTPVMILQAHYFCWKNVRAAPIIHITHPRKALLNQTIHI